MKSTLNELIEDQNKAKKKKQTLSKPTPITLAVPKNASLTKTIPFDIISNHICHFLKMSSITNLACCDRKLAIICHTPTSINNLMHRHDPYKYICDEELIHDGYYYDMNKWTVANIHRFKNVDQLAIEYSYLQKPQIFNSFGRVKHLSLHGSESTQIDCTLTLDPIQIMSSLETIKFVGSIHLPVVLSFLKRYKRVHNQIKQVAFIDCALADIDGWYDLDDDDLASSYAEMIHFLLPPQPNQLQTLKFINASMDKTELTETKDANDHFSDIEVIKSSLRNLKGLVYMEEREGVGNLYFHLTTNILSNLISFKKLESIHTHCNPLISCYLHQNNVPALSNVTELCISVPLQQQDRTSPLYSLHTWLPKLERLCLVIEISDNDHLNIRKFKPIFEKILRNQFRLKVFQIVTLIDCGYGNDPVFCVKRLKIVTEMINECTKVLHLLRIETCTNYSKRPLLFRLHVKSCHYAETKCVIPTNTKIPFIQALENMIVKYLMLYPIGKIQCRFTWNTKGHDLGWELQRNMKGLDTLFKVCVKLSGNVFPFNDPNPPTCCYNKMDFKQGSISAVPKHVSDQDIHHESRWKVDCIYCCNTPWV